MRCLCCVQAVGSILVQSPELLLLPRPTMEASMASLAKLLALPAERAAVLCAEQPSLLATPGKVRQEQVVWF